MQKAKNLFYRNTLLTLLGATRALGKVDFKPPTKWLSLVESIRASSDILYVKLSSMDEELGEEVMQKEEILEKRLGKEKFYSDRELKEIKEKRKDIQVQKPNF